MSDSNSPSSPSQSTHNTDLAKVDHRVVIGQPDSLGKASIRKELTWTAVGLGVALSIIMGAANVYLGLRAGMTVSASIPAAVISMGILRGLLKRSSILESNLVQTAASAGESLAAGIIFTMPALILTGVWEDFDFWTTTIIALAGGLLGVLMMIPMRQVFVVDNPDLKFPEGVACAEVLMAGDETREGSQSGLKLVIAGITVGAVFKFLQSQLGLIRGTAEAATVQSGRVFFLGADILPALVAVGYIVTLPIALQIFAGGAISWLIAIPIVGVGEMTAESPVELAYGIWSTKIRYLGVGAMVVGGVSSIWTVRHGLLAAARQLLDVLTGKAQAESSNVTEKNLSGGVIAALGLLCVLMIGGLYYQLLKHDAGLTVLTTIVMVIMSFFFAAVASYIVGLVGNSNSPVSGMTITAVLGTGGLILLFGFGGTSGIIATLGVAGVVCCVACTSGDVCNDLKTGLIVGASPRSQQIMQVIGIATAAFVMAPVMTILHEGSIQKHSTDEAVVQTSTEEDGTTDDTQPTVNSPSAQPKGGIGSKDLPAPQAGLFASLANGFFGDGQLPYGMVYWGMGVGLVILVIDSLLNQQNSSFRLHLMPVAVGMYLPFGLAIPILLGGVIRTLVDRRDQTEQGDIAHRGILITSGIIAGESLVGVALGLFASLGVKSWNGLDVLIGLAKLPSLASDLVANAISLAALLAVAVWILNVTLQQTPTSTE